MIFVPDYSLSAMLEPISASNLLALLFLVIGITFVHASLGQKPDALDHRVTSTKIMSPALFISGIVLVVVSCVVVVMV